MLGPRQACAAAVFFLVSAISHVAAQNSAAVRGADALDLRKLPQKTVEGIASEAPCKWLIIDTGDAHLIFFAGEQFEFHAPPGKHFVNFKPCLNYEGFRIRVTYTEPTGNGYEGDYRVVQVLAAVSPGEGDNVPKFADDPKPREAPLAPKPQKKWEPPRKPWASAEGTVKEVVCSGPSLTIVLDDSGYRLKLQTDSYKDVPFYSSGGAARNGFNPCKELRGRVAKVEYAPVKNKPYDGELASIEVKE